MTNSQFSWILGLFIASFVANTTLIKVVRSDTITTHSDIGKRYPYIITFSSNILLAVLGGWIAYVKFSFSITLTYVLFNFFAFFVANFYIVVLRRLRESRLKRNPISSTTSKEKYPFESVVGIIRMHKNKRNLHVILTLVTTLFLILLGQIQVIIPVANLLFEISNVSLLIIVSAIFLEFMGNTSFEYRVSKGLYGNNEFEAREIIEFIVRESKNIDFTDNGKLKRIFSEKDLEDLRISARSPIPESTP